MLVINALICILTIAAEHDSQDDAIWQATGSDLQRPSVQRHVETDSNTIQHYAFLGGQDNGGALGIAYLGTTCLQSPGGKNKEKYNGI